MHAFWRRIRPYISTTVRFFQISYLEAASEYSATRIGVLWMPLTTLIFCLVLGLVFHSPGANESRWIFFLYVLSGYVTWTFIADTVSASTSIIQQKLDFAVHSNLSLAGLFAKLVCDRLFEFGINILVLVGAIVLIAPDRLGVGLLLFVPFVIVLSVTSLAVSYLINLLTVYVPDLANVVKAGVRFMFFATPVFWSAAERSDIRVVLERYNPASYYLKMGRQVFGIEPLAGHIWLTGGAISLVVCGVGLYAFRRTEGFVRNIK
jgi:lipopolysaccharide transport system permease protein